MELNYTTKALGNSRFLFMKKEIKDFEGQDALKAINEFFFFEQTILNETQFQWANSNVIYQFERPSHHPDFKQGFFSLGREVVGTPNEQIQEHFFEQDFVAQNIYTLNLWKHLQLNFSFDELCHLEELARAELQNRVDLQLMWRVVFGFEEQKQVNAQIQFFPER